MDRYIIVRRPAERNLDVGKRAGRDPGAGSRPIVSIENLSAREASEASRDDMVQEVAPIMPTVEIAPQDNGVAPAVSGGNWGIAAVGADKTKFSGAGVSVAVLDTGVDTGHPAFDGVKIDPKDFTGDGDKDVRGHGTHCAGIIFGHDVDGERIGVARGITTALTGKVLRDDGRGDSGMLVEALQWAAARKVDIVCISLGFDFAGMIAGRIRDGWPEELAASQCLVAYRANLRVFDAITSLLKAQAGVGSAPLIVAAAGNQSRRRVRADFRIGVSLPAAAMDVISVGAVGRDMDRYRVADFSNAAPTLCAPGVDIVSAWPGGTLHSASGTSMACPFVCGVAALCLEKLRKSGRRVDAAGLAARLRSGATTRSLGEEFDPVDFGEGMVLAPTDGDT